MEGIVDFLRRGGSPKELRQWKSPRSKPPPSDDPKTIGDRIISTISFHQCEAMEEVFKAFTSDRLVLKRPCVHDLLNPSHLGIWDKVAARKLRSPRRVFKRPDEQPLLDRISELIVAGELDDSGWGSEIEWQREVAVAYVRHLMGEREERLGEYEDAFNDSGYEDVFDRPGSVLRLVSHFLLAASASWADLFAYSKESPQLVQLIHFFYHPPAHRNAGIRCLPSDTALVAPELENQDTVPTLPIAPIATATPSILSPSSQSSSSTAPPTFDQFERTDIYARFPHIIHLVTPRFCPSDRCSGQEPKYENFKLVDDLVESLFMIQMEYESVLDISCRIDEIQIDTIRALLPHFASLNFRSFATAGAEELESMDQLIEETSTRLEAAYVSDVDLAVGGALIALSEEFLDIHRDSLGYTRSPCICSLSHLIPDLREYLADTERRFDKLQEETSKSWVAPFDESALYLDVKYMVRCGELSGDFWMGDWERELDIFIRTVSELICRRAVRRHAFYTPLNDRLPHILSAARIIEEVGSVPVGWSTGVLDPDRPHRPISFAPMADLDCAASHASSSQAKLQGDSQVSSIRSDQATTNWAPALNSYYHATTIDPSNFEARLNLAAVRLRMGQHDAQGPQWSRIIYDCSAAIYYGSTSFKAYYRRGYAFTHLDLWKEAIADFDQALLIDPGNVLVELCLAAAKRKSVV